jgi:hypothetical protein
MPYIVRTYWIVLAVKVFQEITPAYRPYENQAFVRTGLELQTDASYEALGFVLEL